MRQFFILAAYAAVISVAAATVAEARGRCGGRAGPGCGSGACAAPVAVAVPQAVYGPYPSPIQWQNVDPGSVAVPQAVTWQGPQPVLMPTGSGCGNCAAPARGRRR